MGSGDAVSEGAAGALRPGEIELDIWDGTYRFRLALGQLRELQDKCNAGPLEIYAALKNGTWKVDYIRETLRLARIGGGGSPGDVMLLVRRYVDERPLLENLVYASAVLGVALTGAGGEAFPKSRRATEKASRPARTENSPSQTSTDGAASSGNRRARSTISRSGNFSASSPDI